MHAEWIPNADWRVIDATIVSLAKKKGELEAEIGRWLLAAHRERVDRRRPTGVTNKSNTSNNASTANTSNRVANIVG